MRRSRASRGTWAGSRRPTAALDAEASALPDGRAYFVRKRRDRLAADLLASRLAAFELAIDDSLARLGVDIGWPEQRRETTAGAEAAVARKPLLVARDSFPALEDRLAAIEVEHAALHLQFELAGPLPPYSFTGDLDLKGSRPH